MAIKKATKRFKFTPFSKNLWRRASKSNELNAFCRNWKTMDSWNTLVDSRTPFHMSVRRAAAAKIRKPIPLSAWLKEPETFCRLPRVPHLWLQDSQGWLSGIWVEKRDQNQDSLYFLPPHPTLPWFPLLCVRFHSCISWKSIPLSLHYTLLNINIFLFKLMYKTNVNRNNIFYGLHCQLLCT